VGVLRPLAGRGALILLHAFLLLQAAGCEAGGFTSSAVETHVREDAGAERRVLVDASPPGPSLTLSESWSIQRGVDAGERSAALSRSYEDLTLGAAENGGMELEVEDHFFWTEYSFSDRLGGVLEGGRRISGDFGYKLVMPGRISEAPGAARRAGSVAVYDLGGGEGETEVRAESWKVRWWAVSVTVAALLGVAALIAGGRVAGVIRGALNWLWTGRWSGTGG
jgi:hypothetical protein